MGVFQKRSQFTDFVLVSAGQDWKPAPGFGVQVFIVQVKAGRISFPLPLIAAPKSKKLDRPFT
jgi:hypothetical protein